MTDFASAVIMPSHATPPSHTSRGLRIPVASVIAFLCPLRRAIRCDDNFGNLKTGFAQGCYALYVGIRVATMQQVIDPPLPVLLCPLRRAMRCDDTRQMLTATGLMLLFPLRRAMRCDAGQERCQGVRSGCYALCVGLCVATVDQVETLPVAQVAMPFASGYALRPVRTALITAILATVAMPFASGYALRLGGSDAQHPAPAHVAMPFASGYALRRMPLEHLPRPAQMLPLRENLT